MGLGKISSRVVTVGLVGLMALDVVLVSGALRSTHTSRIDTSPLSSTSAFPGHPGAPVLPASSTLAAAPLETMLAAVDNRHAWRVGAGSCSAGGATVAMTADGGRTWTRGKTHLSRIVRVRSLAGLAAFVIGTSASCTAQLRSSSNGGATWASADYLSTLWFRDPKDPRVVRVPGPSTAQPCGKGAVLDLAVVLSTDSARVLCVDGLVRSSTYRGSSWADMGTVTGAVALAVLSAQPLRTYVARVGVQGCAGVSILRVGQRVATSCVRTAAPNDPGQIALSLDNGGGWLAVGNTTWRSTDNLLTWRVS